MIKSLIKDSKTTGFLSNHIINSAPKINRRRVTRPQSEMQIYDNDHYSNTLTALNKFRPEVEKSPETLQREKERTYCTVSMHEHIRVGEVA